MIPHDANSAAEERRRISALDPLSEALAEILRTLGRDGPEYCAVVLRRAAKLLERPPAPPGLPGPEAVERARRRASARAQRRAVRWGS